MKRQKNDAAHAEVICEAVTRHTMHFVPIKSPEQQSAIMLHRSRALLVKQRTMRSWLPSGNYRSAIFYTDEQQKETALATITEIEASGLRPGPVVTEINPEEPLWQAVPALIWLCKRRMHRLPVQR